MALIKSISGIRGTIGDTLEDGLNPVSIAKFTAAYAAFITKKSKVSHPRIVVGRDARVSGFMLKNIVNGTLMAMGCDIIDIDFATTPTTEMAVSYFKADGGIILTASHNPYHWNALKLLASTGEFLTEDEGKEVLDIAEKNLFIFSQANNLGTIVENINFTSKHIEAIIALDLVDTEAIKKANLTIVADCINSVGALALPPLFDALGVKKYYLLNGEANGNFAHNPEPIPENLEEICSFTKTHQADVGFIVDPDVDRLAIVDENGHLFGEEYTLVAVADYILEHFPGGNTVSNLSSTRALQDITKKHNGIYTSAAVGEVNVTTQMKKVNAIIGGEGNGGIIYPALHYGRDALLGIALFLSHLAHKNIKVSELRKEYPNYYMSKQKILLDKTSSPEEILTKLTEMYAQYSPNIIDGVKIDFLEKWVHIRKSNTEPIIRIYTEAKTAQEAENLANEFVQIISNL